MVSTDKFERDHISTYIAVFASCFLLISIPLRLLTRKLKHSFPMGVLVFPIAFLIGTMIFFTAELTLLDMIIKIPPELLTGVYLPVYIFSTVYNTDHYIFMRCLPQVIITCIGIFTVISIIIAIVLRDILHQDLDYRKSLVAALISLPIQPKDIISLLKDLAKYKYLGIMLEVESLLMLIPVMISVQVAFGYMEGIQTKWYQYFLLYVRYYVGGLIIGYLMGKITTKLMALYYNIPKSVVTISIGMSFLTYFLSEHILYISGPLTIMLLSLRVNVERHRFTMEVENCMTCFWSIIAYKWENVFSMFLGVITTYHFWQFFFVKDVFSSIITYFSAMIARFTVLIILYPIMNIHFYKIDVKCLLILGWSNVKGIVNLMLLNLLLTTRSTSPFIQMFYLEFMLYCHLTNLLNTPSMKLVISLLGVTELSSTRKSNMNNSMQYILQKRKYNIDIFKLNRYLANVNWKLVRKETVVKHPYLTKMNEEDVEIDEEDDEEDLLSSLVCPDCINQLPYNISEKEIKEMIKDAHIKILKAKKVSIIKQYENGVINKNCVQMLVYTFELMIDSYSQKNTINLQTYLKRNRVLETIYYILSALNMETIHEPPDTLFNRLCFYIVMHKAYNYFIWAYCVLYVIIFSIFMEPATNTYLFGYAVATIVLFSIEVILKALALSRNNIILHGLTCYYKFKWNIFDFILLTISYYDLMCIFIHNLGYIEIPRKLHIGFYIGEVRLLTNSLVLLQPIYSALMVAIRNNIDSKICFGYDLATALVNCCDEVLMMIGHIIDVSIIKGFFTKQLQLEKLELIRIMEEVQSVRPYIAITVKTKQAIRTTLNAMEDCLNDLKVSGFVDTVEYVYILKEIFDKQKYLRNLKFVEPSPPKRLFFEVPWMTEDIIKEYLYRRAQKVFWNKGEVVCKEGKSPHGIYVFIGGLLKLRYRPRASLENMKSAGRVPIIDYYGSYNFQEAWEDRITSGNSVGELSFLTGRPYDCTIVADSSSQAYFLSTEVMHQAMKLSKNPVNGLEARMWKWSTINMAVAILANVPLYQIMTQEQIKFKLQRAFMPNISCYKMFVITDMMDDVILMEGIAADYNYGHMFVAPMHLPRTTQKLILPRSSYLDLDDKLVVKLLVIPVANCNETQIMIEEEEMAELVPSPSSSCLLQLKVNHEHKLKFHRQKNIEPLLNKESYFSLSMFKTNSKDKFEVLESAHEISTVSSGTTEEINKKDKLQLLTQNKTLDDVERSEQNFL